MSVFKATIRRSKAEPTLVYMYRGDKHEHEINLIRHIGGNIFSPDPIIRDDITGLPLEVDLEMMIKEFEFHADLHDGKGEKLYKHYIVSLAPGETLEDHEWLEHIQQDLMPSLGYDESTKYVICRHSDRDNEHCHIFACLVKGDGSLVKTNNDVFKGLESMRRLEKKYGLRELESPENNWGHHYSKAKMKGANSDRELAIKRDDAAIIRARFKAIESQNGGKLPGTMTKMVFALARRGVDVKCRQDDNGNIIGISYSADGGSFISGSKVKATRLSFKNLQLKERVSYVPELDNTALLGEWKDAKEFTIQLQITASQFKRIKAKRPPNRAYKIKNRDWNRYYVDLSFCRSNYERDLALLFAEIVKLFDVLFGSLSDADFNFMMRLEHQRQWEAYKAELAEIYEPAQEKVYDAEDCFGLTIELDEDTEWRYESQDTTFDSKFTACF
ncbi:relaxase/mobilization nuclease domain-containing protein [Agarivorans aestuarii]|uniref:Relaxase/mobilization nuclease domain-containing protein n=1 Tax=Agarivorans aestuarii TaxID=1563703 RepID=A0ABU7G0B3_9ALTE|nr:relaxase/mobilization nuclease domain-containing protein [Agarivorans aestuarii]MEE1672858.1 relaxase/mobilization nuclease domain-containing protein [Agarivorans aestuarii]